MKIKGGKRRAGRLITRPIDMSNVLDLHAATSDPVTAGVARQEVAGYTGPAYTFAKHPGLVYLPAALPPDQQRQLTAAALTDYPEPPARTNHTLQYGPLPGLWRAAQQGRQEGRQEGQQGQGRPLRLNWTRKDDPGAGASRRVGCAHVPPKPHRYPPDLAVTERLQGGSQPAAGATERLQGGSQPAAGATERLQGGSQPAAGAAGTGVGLAPGGAAAGIAAVPPELRERESGGGEGAGAGGRISTGGGSGGGVSSAATSRRSSDSSGAILADMAMAGRRRQRRQQRRARHEGVGGEGHGAAANVSGVEGRSSSCGGCSSSSSSDGGGGGGCSAASFDDCWSADGPGPTADQLLRKLRWATLGPQFDWTQRQYDFTESYRRLPPSLEALAKQLAAVVDSLQVAGLAVLPQSETSGRYEPDAAIVNYYQQGDMLGGHLDDVERDMAQPIVSVSLGCAAVFLMGGPSKEVPPTALLLRSGDVLVLAGAARRCYHGVPRILESAQQTGRWAPEHAGCPAGEDSHVEGYFRCARINISIRAVR